MSQAPQFDDTEHVQIPTEEFLKYIQNYDGYDFRADAKPPVSYLCQSTKVTGKTDGDHVELDYEFSVLQVVDQWITCPLLHSQTTIQKCTVTFNDKVVEGHIGISSGNHCLMTKKKGTYTIKLTACVPYISDRKQGVSLNFPSVSLKNQLRFKVLHDKRSQLQLRVEPCIDSKQLDPKNAEVDGELWSEIESNFPPTRTLTVHWTRQEHVVQETRTVEKEIVEKKRPLTINVEQNTLHSIGGGVVSIITDLNYSILNASVNHFYIAVAANREEKKLRVLKVEGSSIKKWDCKKMAANQASSVSTSVATIDQHSDISGGSTPVISAASVFDESVYDRWLIRVFLETGVEGSYTLKVFSEMETAESGSSELKLPTFGCLNVNREKGYLAIEATTSVEIDELDSKQLTKVGKEEVPRTLQARASNPIVHAYKFLNSKYILELNVKKHDDVSVLVAVIEEAWFECTYANGLLLHRVLLKVKNTNQHFIKVLLKERQGISEGSSLGVWSTSVEGNSVRPAKDKQNRILIPLKKTSPSQSEVVFTVELFYLEQASTLMKDSGVLSLEFARFNTPINHAFFSVNVPSNFKYAEFEGELKEISYYSKSPTVESLLATEKSRGSSAYGQQPQYSQMRQQMQQQMAPQMQQMPNMQMNMMSNMSYNAAPPQPMPMPQSNRSKSKITGFGGSFSGGKRAAQVGVLPIQISGLRIGTNFKFETLMMVPIADTEEEFAEEIKSGPIKHFNIRVPFKQIKKGYFDKRSITFVNWPIKSIVKIIMYTLVALLMWWLYTRISSWWRG